MSGNVKHWYICDVNPVPWRVGPVGAVRNASTGRMKGYVGKDQELDAYQEALRAALAEQNPVMIEGSIKVTMWFWRTIDEYKTEKAAKAQANIADGTNLYKAAEDACQGVLFKNDRANISGQWYIVEQNQDADSRVVICVEVLSHGIRGEALAALPDEVYHKIFSEGAYQLELSLNAPNTQLSADDERYANADPIF